MALMLPREVDWVLGLLGCEWPDANEDEIHSAATAWRQFALTAARLGSRGVAAASAIRSSNAGEAVEAFEEKWRKFESGGDGYLNDAVEAANAIAFALDTVAMCVLTSKLAVIAQLIALAFEIAAAQAAAPLTFGLSELGAVGAVQITRVVVRRLLDELKQVIVTTIADTLKEASVRALRDMVQEVVTAAAKEGATAMGQDLIEQGVKANFGAQDGIDLKDAAGKGLGAFKESATKGLKDGLMGVKDNIVGLADPGTYVDAVTQRAAQRAEAAAD
ncbi:PE-PGRS family protein [Streptomyces sp. ISL-96]|uniref:WXG100-like domain-containing protein n=1 Tax=Streptomyces sp. ISL-96 TaxID=2819191 RepID=UPI001BE5336A|nr:PE-PGRS family protein [Streptomyces sp. ISL-96]MBT2490900.1 PE-PGRS family protein [Streptomyces sp. ISL-96]